MEKREGERDTETETGRERQREREERKEEKEKNSCKLNIKYVTRIFFQCCQHHYSQKTTYFLLYITFPKLKKNETT